jgi:hypothetical protein
MAKPTYRMVGFGWDGPELWKGVASDHAQQIAEDNDLHGYLLHPPWQARRKKRDEERTRRYGRLTDKPYKQTSCRRLMFTVLLNRKWDHIPDDEEIRTK